MRNLSEQISTIEDKVKKVLTKLEELTRENSHLSAQNERLSEEIAQLKSKKQEVIQIASPPIVPIRKDKYEMIRSELDHYIEEIDQTIQLLKAS